MTINTFILCIVINMLFFALNMKYCMQSLFISSRRHLSFETVFGRRVLHSAPVWLDNFTVISKRVQQLFWLLPFLSWSSARPHWKAKNSKFYSAVYCDALVVAARVVLSLWWPFIRGEWESSARWRGCWGRR